MIKQSGLANCLWVSDPIHIGSYFEPYVQKLSPEIKALQKNGVDNYDVNTMSSIMGTSHTVEQFHELITYCAEDKLDVPDEPATLNVRRVTTRHRLFDRSTVPSSNICDLATLKNLRLLSKERNYFRGLKYTKSIFINNEPTERSDLQVKKDIVISIRIHDTIFPSESCLTKHASHEIVVLGSQTLTALRDKIICPTDYTTSYQDSEKLVQNIGHVSCKKAKDVFKSGFFFIEDTFYNDFRNPNNIDYSEVIKKWAKYKGIGPLNEASMSDVKFQDLTVRFGYPYAYQHQGNCEHLLVFSDASLLHEEDVGQASQYPVLKSMALKKPQECMICCYYTARWITFGNERVPVDPFYFCDQCFKSYNYINGKKIGDFKAYKYHPFLPLSLE